MDILCDVIALDARGHGALATPTPVGWILPTVRTHDAARITDDVRHLVERAGIDCVVVHEAWLPVGAGEKPDPRRYCVVVAASDAAAGAKGPVQWIDLDSLLTSRPAFPAQLQGLRICLDRMRHPVAPFDQQTSTEASRRWIDEALEQCGRARSGPIRLLGCDRFYRVAEVPTHAGPVFFKGGDPSVLAEARMTALVADVAPGHAARTLAIDPRGWWLMDGLAGQSLAAGCQKQDVLVALTTLATIQRRLAFDPSAELTLGPPVRLDNLCAAVDLTLEEFAPTASVATAVRHNCDLLKAALDSCQQIPLTWVHGDLAPANVLSFQGRIAFIDLNASIRGCPLLPLWRLLNALKTQGVLRDQDLNDCRDAYEMPWREAGINSSRQLWPILRELGILLRIWTSREMLRLWAAYESNTYGIAMKRENLLRLVSALGTESLAGVAIDAAH